MTFLRVLLDWIADLVASSKQKVLPAPEVGSRFRDLTVSDDGWLQGEGVRKYPSSRCYSKLSTKDGKPTAIVWHWTAVQVDSDKLAKRIQTGEGSSWHVLIAKDGSLIQSVPFIKGAWHCAAGKIDGIAPNRCSVGVEMENLGEVREDDAGVYRGGRMVDGKWTYDSKGPKAQGVIAHGKKSYEAWTPAQIEAAERLARCLKTEYGMTDKNLSWGHVDLDPKRRSDPGPVWAKQVLPGILKKLK